LPAQWYPVFLDVEGKDVLVVGSGTMAQEKVDGLAAAGARVEVVAADAFEDAHVDGKSLVIAATNERVGARVAAAASSAHIFCNVADVPHQCSFILPAIHREGAITVAVSTGGASPALAQWIRGKVAELVGPRHAELAERLRSLRPWAKANLPTYAERRDYFQQIVREELGA
jgi:precorrin-2 dehydrogenase / sirohydrochlorin ferrochelatase